MDPQPKRTRFDASALTPADTKALTPMAAARQSLISHCESLQPEIATILSKLGLERLQILHKLSHKSTQAKKIEEDTTFIPRSARVNFALSASNSVNKDEEYIRLVDETNNLTTAFQLALKTQILSVAKLEASTLQKQLCSDFATSIRLAVEACLLCEDKVTINVDTTVNTLLTEYSNQLLAHLDMNLGAFQDLYKRTHTLTVLPAAVPLVIPTDRHSHRVTLPSQATLLAFAKLHRTLDTVFLAPWAIYIDVQARNAVSLQIKQLGENHFAPKITEETAMLVDAEGAVEPQLLKDFIQKQIDSHNKSLKAELKDLRSRVATPKVAKNDQRGPPSASNKKKTGKKNESRVAAAAHKDSDAAKPKKKTSAPSKRKSKKSSQPKPRASPQQKKTSKKRS
jgi:hypothetical protein